MNWLIERLVLRPLRELMPYSMDSELAMQVVRQLAEEERIAELESEDFQQAA